MDSQQYNNVQNYNYNRKSKLSAVLLAIFLGAFGAHNFYLGYTIKGVIQLCITLFTFGFGAFVTIIWGIIEAILLLTGLIYADAKGIPLVGNEQAYKDSVMSKNTIDVHNYQNDFKVKINEIKNDENATIINGEVIQGSISVGEKVRIEKLDNNEFVESKIINIIEDGMNVAFSMDKNLIIKIEQIGIDDISNEMIR